MFYQFQICILGDTNVGKSTFASMLSKGEFVERHNDGIAEATKDIVVNQRKIRLKILITSGKEPFRSVVWAFFRECVGILLLFDITSRDSFDNLRKWYEELQLYSDIETKQLILVCNKCDHLTLDQSMQEKHWISYEEGDQFAATHQMQFYITSSKYKWVNIENFTTVEQIFMNLTSNILTMLDVLHEQQQEEQQIPGVYDLSKLNEQRDEINSKKKKIKKRSGCC